MRPGENATSLHRRWWWHTKVIHFVNLEVGRPSPKESMGIIIQEAPSISKYIWVPLKELVREEHI